MPDYLATFRTRLLHAEALVELARGQRTLAEAGDLDGLIESLQRKGRIIDRMTAACDDAFRAQWRIDREHIADSLRQECEMLLDRCEQNLDETLDHERRAIETVTIAREKIDNDLRNLTESRQTQAGYATQNTRPQRSLLDLSR